MSSYEIPGQTDSVEAAGDLTTSYYRFVKLAGATVVAIAATTDVAYGILQNKPNRAGMASTVMLSGISRCFTSKAVPAGVEVFLGADGRVTDASGGTAVGISRSAATAADQLIAVQIKSLAAVA